MSGYPALSIHVFLNSFNNHHVPLLPALQLAFFINEVEYVQKIEAVMVILEHRLFLITP